jgi:hypothetical protein
MIEAMEIFYIKICKAIQRRRRGIDVLIPYRKGQSDFGARNAI